MLEMLANCGWNSVLCLFCLDYGLYIMHLSHSNAHDLVFSLVLWMFALLSSNCRTKTLEYLFYFIVFINIVLACSFIVWEQILEQTYSHTNVLIFRLRIFNNWNSTSWRWFSTGIIELFFLDHDNPIFERKANHSKEGWHDGSHVVNLVMTQ